MSASGEPQQIELSYCVVNTGKRELLLRGLDAIARERAQLPFASEVLVLDNCSRDGSAEAAAAHPAVDETIALARRTGKAANDSMLLERARGRYALLLNEDSELLPDASLALWSALEDRPHAALAGAQLLDPRGRPQPCAWRFPSPMTALAGALFLHRLLVVQSRGDVVREVDWCQSSALLVRRSAAAEVDYLDADFFVYSDEVDFAKRVRDAGWSSLYVPDARAVHHEQLSSDAARAAPRIVELARNRDLYMRKHHSAAAALAVRWLTAWTYALRALAAPALPGHSARRSRRRMARACARLRVASTTRWRAKRLPREPRRAKRLPREPRRAETLPREPRVGEISRRLSPAAVPVRGRGVNQFPKEGPYEVRPVDLRKARLLR